MAERNENLRDSTYMCVQQNFRVAVCVPQGKNSEWRSVYIPIICFLCGVLIGNGQTGAKLKAI